MERRSTHRSLPCDASAYHNWGCRTNHLQPPPFAHKATRGSVCYILDGVYYRAPPGGYLVVERPVETVVTMPTEQATTVPSPSETRVIYAPKQSADGVVPVTLRKLDSDYLGPQGEFYPEMPSAGQLTEIYGSK